MLYSCDDPGRRYARELIEGLVTALSRRSGLAAFSVVIRRGPPGRKIILLVASSSS
jgi:hypothetical protein